MINLMKNRRNQYIFAVMIILALLVCFFTMTHNFFMHLIFGVLFGFSLQRSRFCFASAFRDPLLIGNTKLANALLLSLAIMTLFFPLIQKVQLDRTGILVGSIDPVGIHTVFGALVFGFGMVIAGGCASGTLMRVGEAYMLQFLVLAGFVIGSLLGAVNFEWWNETFIHESPTIFLPNIFSWIGAVLFQLILLFVVYLLVRYYSRRKKML